MLVFKVTETTLNKIPHIRTQNTNAKQNNNGTGVYWSQTFTFGGEAIVFRFGDDTTQNILL